MFTPSNETVMAIGRLVLASAEYEAALASAVSRVVGKAATVLVVGIPVSQQEQALKVLTERERPEAVEDLAAILRVAKELGQDRAHVVHGFWMFDVHVADEQVPSDIALRPKRWTSDLRGKRFPVEKLVEVTRKFGEIQRQLDAWSAAHWPQEQVVRAPGHGSQTV